MKNFKLIGVSNYYIGIITYNIEFSITLLKKPMATLN